MKRDMGKGRNRFSFLYIGLLVSLMHLIAWPVAAAPQCFERHREAVQTCQQTQWNPSRAGRSQRCEQARELCTQTCVNEAQSLRGPKLKRKLINHFIDCQSKKIGMFQSTSEEPSPKARSSAPSPE